MCLERNCIMQNMPIAPRVWQCTAPSLLKQSSLPLSSVERALLEWGLLPLPTGPQSWRRASTLTYQKHGRKEHSSLAQAVQRICSRRVWARCAALSETDFTAVYIHSPALIYSFLACPWYGSEGGITWLLNAWNDGKHFSVNWGFEGTLLFTLFWVPF